MFKKALIVLAGLLFTGTVYAASPLNAQIEAPQSPTNQTDLTINVVVLDQNQVPSISVQCYYQKNGGGWNALGSPITVIPGGNNTANCTTTSNQVNDDGTYQFYASVTDGTNNVNTSTVSVNFTRSGPGTPTSYSKNKNSCTYQISFHTASDNGKTVKVEIYRSTNTNFSADGSTKVGQVSIGSNADGTYNDNPPNCNTTYYYAIRAFDAAGNGSGVIGDSQTVTTVVTGTSGASGASGAPGAIPAGTNGNVLGSQSGALTGATGASGGVLGEATRSATPTPTSYVPPKGSVFSKHNLLYIGGAILAIVFIVWLLQRKPPQE